MGVFYGSKRSPHTVVHRAAGHQILEEGERSQNLLYVHSGVVLLTSSTPSGVELFCSYRGAGSILALEALAEQPSPYQAWSLTEVEHCPMPVAEVRRAIERRPEIAWLVDRTIDELVRSISDRRNLGGRAMVRVARFLLQRERIVGESTTLNVPHHILARMLGMRAETFSRALKQLRNLRVLDASAELKVLDHEALEAVAEEG